MPTDTPRAVHLWSLREDVHVEIEPVDGTVILHSRWGYVTVRRPQPVIREVLRRMSLGPTSLENVVGKDAAEYADVWRILDSVSYLVVRSLGLDAEHPVLSVVPIAPLSRFDAVTLSPETPVRLSKYALLRTDGTDYCLESPLSLHRVLLHRPEGMWLISAMNRAVTPARAAAVGPDSGLPVTDALAYLAASEMLVVAEDAEPAADRPPAFAEEAHPALRGWSPYDLMFHTRSTLGRHDRDFGATYPLGEIISPEPVVKPAAGGPAIPLYRPRWEELLRTDPPVTAAVEGRCSVREYDSEPPSARELGELLYRTSRVRAISQSVDPEQPSEALSDRPYPSSGAAHELELYITVNECSGLARGVYHYDPLRHQLEAVDADAAIAGQMLKIARLAANLSEPPPVLITMNARFRRLSWKYNGLSYALALKHVGVLTQNLYLISTAMGLAACALGSGDIDVCARALGTDWRTESCVGGFMLGRRPKDWTDPRRWPLAANDPSWKDLAAEHLKATE